jgi:malonate transporter MadM subunit
MPGQPAMIDVLQTTLTAQALLVAFIVVGAIMLVSNRLARTLTGGRIHGSAIAIVIGLVLAWVSGVYTGGSKGLADVPMLAGIGLMGGAMLRDFAIVATAFDVDIKVARRAGLAGLVAIVMGIILPFVVGASIAPLFGYSDAVSMTTIGAGAVTYIVGPVTGAALGASSDVMALSVAVGVLKAVLVMVVTPLVAKSIGLNNPSSAMVFGGVMGTTSGVTAGLAATDPKLVPYGALTSTFYTGAGCLLGPSLLYLAVRAIVGG